MSWRTYIEDKIKEGNATKTQLIFKVGKLLTFDKISQEEHDEIVTIINESNLGA